MSKLARSAQGAGSPTMRFVMSAALALSAVVFAAPSKAGGLPIIGDHGDFKEEYRCPSGQMLVGFHGKTGAWIDQLGLICAWFRQPFHHSEGQNRLNPRGGPGGGAAEQSCEPNSAIREVTIELDDYGRFVGVVKFSCLRPVDGSFAGGKVFGGNGDHTFSGTQQCLESQYATGININYGKHVNGIGLICGDFYSQAPLSPTMGPGMEDNIDRPGSDYEALQREWSPIDCQVACRNDDSCHAWTFVRKGVHGDKPVCYLKNAAPSPVVNLCCVSGSEAWRRNAGVTQAPDSDLASPDALKATGGMDVDSGQVSGAIEAGKSDRMKSGAMETGGLARSPPRSAQGPVEIAGTFNTDFGVLTLIGNPATSGTYTSHDGRVTIMGRRDNTVDGDWEESSGTQKCADGRYRGHFHWEFTQDGFTGSYGYCDGPADAGAWNGTRR